MKSQNIEKVQTKKRGKTKRYSINPKLYEAQNNPFMNHNNKGGNQKI